MSQAASVTADTFEQEVIKSDIPVVVDFWAEWCMPCKQMAPIVDQIATEMAGKIKVMKCDVGADPSVASKYGISSIPTLLIFKGGEPVERMVGVKKKDEVVSKINGQL
jgi:thioredoxin 1